MQLQEINNNYIKNKVKIRMTDGYGIATNYYVKNECPQCQSKLVKTGEHTGCYDGEWTWTDKFTCENKCFITYTEVFSYNQITR